MHSLTVYAAACEAALRKLVLLLQADERFVAAWLVGSYGRGEQDAWSDLDISIVVTDAVAVTLCARPRQVSGWTTPDRLAVYTWLGQPSIIHENHHNALPGGTMAVVLYTDALDVDWSFVPLAQAQRPTESILLFDRVGIPLQAPPTPEALDERVHKLSERVAFFWLMTAVAIRTLRRGDGVAFHTFLSWLFEMVTEVERLLRGEAWHYRKTPPVPLSPTQAEQAQAIRGITGRMAALMPQVVAQGAVVPHTPMAVIDTLLALH